MTGLPNLKAVLTESAYKAFRRLQGLLLLRDFYLAGGTGLAFRIGHRVSMDFDFFSPANKLSSAAQERLIEQLRQGGDFVIESIEEGTVQVTLGGTQVSFFYYPYPLMTPTTEIAGVQVASLEDIGLMKLAAIISRGSKKDFIDLYFIIRDHFPLKHLLKLGDKKYKEARDFYVQALKALVFFEDAEREKMPLMLEDVSWTEIKKSLAEAVSEATRGEITKEL